MIEHGDCEALIYGSLRTRCSRIARHWTHVVDGSDGEPFPRGRVELCTQHFNMIEKRRRQATAAATLARWRDVA